jgi:HlyD family secretion protein
VNQQRGRCNSLTPGDGGCDGGMAHVVLVALYVIAASNIAGPADGPEPRPVAALAIAAPASPIDTAAKKSWLGMHRKRIIIALLALVPLIALASLAWHLLSRPKGSGFRMVRVVRADITERVTATGTLQPVITSPVGAQVSGIVAKLHADFNSQVKAGDLLVELDPALFQNAVAMATAQLAQAKANLTSAHASARGAVSVRDRTRLLERKSLVSNADLDASEAVFGQTAGQSRSGAAQIAQAYAQLDKARLDYQHSIIRAPVDGTVISRNIDVGQAVAATLTAPTLFTIARDLHHMQVHAAVDEADIGGVRTGQNATFTVDAFRDQTFGAVVHEVRNAPQTLSNVVTYDVVLDVENPDLKLRPGMTANVLILIVQKSQVTAVPNEALRFRPATGPATAGSMKVAPPGIQQSAAVYVVEGGRAVRVAIKLGVTDGNMTEVDGLDPGREVIVDVVRSKGKAPAAGGSGRGM